MFRYLIFRIFLVLLTLLLCVSVWGGQNVVVVLDDSGSMADRMGNSTRMEVAKKALLVVLGRLPEDAKVGIVCLNNGWIYPLQEIDSERLRAAVLEIRSGGGTPLGAHLKVGADALLELREKEHYGKYKLLIVTDGEEQDWHLTNKYLPDIISKGITTDAIGLDMDGEHSIAKKVHMYRRGDDPASLEKAILEVFAETSDQGGASQEDFAAIANLDDEVAKEVLVALSRVVNAPIGEKPQPRFNDEGKVILDKNGNLVLEEDMGLWPISFLGWFVMALMGGCLFLIAFRLFLKG